MNRSERPRRPFRVLIVTHHALPHVGGVENVVDLEIRGLAAAGHDVRLLTSDKGGAGRRPQYPANVRVERIPAWHGLEDWISLPYPLFSPWLIIALLRALDWCDVLHAHGFMFMNSALAVWLAAGKGKPCLLTDHGGIQRFPSRAITAAARFGAETVGRISTLLASRLVTFNSRIAEDLKRLGKKEVAFLPNPVDRSLFRPSSHDSRIALRQELGWDLHKPIVLFVGRLIASKGIPLLLQLADSTVEIVFCGPGDPGILGPLPRPGIQYLPPRPQADIVRLYQAADVLVLPSLREGFPLVVQEALACGLPVVLGYEPGFEPYRGLCNLHFCERTVDSVRAAVHEALANTSQLSPEGTGLEESLLPPPEAWQKRMLDLLAPRSLDKASAVADAIDHPIKTATTSPI